MTEFLYRYPQLNRRKNRKELYIKKIEFIFQSLRYLLTKTIGFSYLYFKETKIIDSHPTLKKSEDRFKKVMDSLVASFQIEGIHFEEEDLKKIVGKLEKELKK